MALSEAEWTLRVVEAMIIHAQAWLDEMWTQLPIELIGEVDTLCIDLAIFQCRIEKGLAGDCVKMETSLEELVTQYKDLKGQTFWSYTTRGIALGIIEGVEGPVERIE